MTEESALKQDYAFAQQEYLADQSRENRQRVDALVWRLALLKKKP